MTEPQKKQQNKKGKVDRKGNKNPMFHKTHSDEAKEKIRKKIKEIWRRNGWN
jgi:hypothetical protein